MNDFDALTQLNKNTGHDEALLAWYELKFKKIVSTVIFKFGFEQFLAEDIAQEVLLKAAVKIGDIKNESAVKGWLNKIVRNACIDQVRKLTIKPDEPKEIPKEASIYNVKEENGLKITEYSRVEIIKNGARKFKFNVQYTKVNDDGSDNQTFDELLDSFASDIDLYQESPEKDLMQKNLVDCVQTSISEFHQIDPQKAEAIRLLMLDTPKIEIAIQLNKSPKAIREYLSQCYKKIESFVKPCQELYKLA
jgi:RNA polymerase sigma factor (sigma-70 family)